jgi:endonuclease YncB( thermonuclease family)
MQMAKMLLVALVLALGIGFSAGALPGYPYPTVWGTVVNVVDGNRIVIAVVGSTTGEWIPGSSETVRYIGAYVSPTDGTDCSLVAPQVNYQITFGRLVYLEFDQQMRDADGTIAAYVYLDGAGMSMVNAMLVAVGISKATLEEPNTRYASYFLSLEAAATAAGLGCPAAP